MKKLTLAFLVIAVLCLSACGSKAHTVEITYMTDGGQLSMDVPYELQTATDQVYSESPQWYPPTPYRYGYVFENWYLDADYSTLYTHVALQEKKELTLYAKYIPALQDDFFIVSFIAHGGTFMPNQKVENGGLLTKPSDPVLEGHTFSHWEYVDMETGETMKFDFSQKIQENMVLDAIYTNN